MSQIETTNKILKGAAGYIELFAEVPLTGGGMFSTQGMSLALQGESYDRRNPPKMQYDQVANMVCIHMNKRVYARGSIIPEDAHKAVVEDKETWTGSLRGLPNCVAHNMKDGTCTITDFTSGERVVIRSEGPVLFASMKGERYIQAWTGAGCNSYTSDGTLVARETVHNGLRYEDLGDALVADEAPFTPPPPRAGPPRKRSKPARECHQEMKVETASLCPSKTTPCQQHIGMPA